MDKVLHRVRAARRIELAAGLLFEASEDAREGGALELPAKLEDVTAELFHLHREVLELPPQRSTSLQDREEDVPF
jgi:hypothetical protein